MPKKKRNWREVVGKTYAVCRKCGAVKILTKASFQPGKATTHDGCGGTMIQARKKVQRPTE